MFEKYLWSFVFIFVGGLLDVLVILVLVIVFYCGCMILEVNWRLLDLDEVVYKYSDIIVYFCLFVEFVVV